MNFFQVYAGSTKCGEIEYSSGKDVYTVECGGAVASKRTQHSTRSTSFSHPLLSKHHVLLHKAPYVLLHKTRHVSGGIKIEMYGSYLTLCEVEVFGEEPVQEEEEVVEGK